MSHILVESIENLDGMGKRRLEKYWKDKKFPENRWEGSCPIRADSVEFLLLAWYRNSDIIPLRPAEEAKPQ